MCCPDTAETCGCQFYAEVGSVCCSDDVCPAGTACNELGGQNCCKDVEISCEDTCTFAPREILHNYNTPSYKK
jgi:hypothetical protein